MTFNNSTFLVAEVAVMLCKNKKITKDPSSNSNLKPDSNFNPSSNPNVNPNPNPNDNLKQKE